MLNRIAVNTLLKSVIAMMALAVTVIFALGAWDSWSRLVVVNRMAAAADASGYIFTVLHNIRIDRSSTTRNLRADKQQTTQGPLVAQVRTAELAALKSSLAALDVTDFPERQTVVSTLAQKIAKLTALHSEADVAITQPKAQRRAGLADEFLNEVNNLVDFLDKAGVQLSKSVKLEDSYVDQLMTLKQIAWLARNSAGDASVMISNFLAGTPVPADAMLKYTELVSKADIAWAALEDIASGLPLPARFTAALDKARREFFAPEYVEVRMTLMKKLMAGQPVDTKVADWTPMSVAKLASMLNVAEVALEIAKEHTAELRAQALWKLWAQLALLFGAVAVAGGMMFIVTRRVTGPLLQIQQAMLKVAGGDFSVVLPGLDRKDEIGQVSNAVERFKVLADEKARTEAAEAVQRQQVETDRQAELANAEAAVQAKVAEERAKVAEEQTQAVEALGVGLIKLSNGELSFRLTNAFPDAYVALKENFNSTMAQLEETIRSLTQAAREVTNASAEISTSTTDLSQRTEEQAASLEQTSASMEEIAVTVKKNAENAQQANQSASATRDVADRGGQVVAKAVDAMAKIEELLAQDLRHHRRHRRDRPPDQPAGAQRGGGSRARRRGRPRLCGGGLRGA